MAGFEGEGKSQRGGSREVVNVENPRCSKSSAKRPALENGAKLPTVSALQQAKKRNALASLSNQHNIAANLKSAETSVSSLLKSQGLVETTTSKVKITTLNSRNANDRQQNVGEISVPKQPRLQVPINQNSSRNNETCNTLVSFYPTSCRSDGESESMDESMSTSDSTESREVEYMDNDNPADVASLEKKTLQNLYISKHSNSKSGQDHPFQGSSPIEAKPKELHIVDVDTDHMDPRMCTVYARDIDQHIRDAEQVKRRAAANYMEEVQEDINANMRGILIDWLVEVAEEYKLVPDTLYLTVSYIDRYLSNNVVNRQRLQLLGVTCMLIAAKYEEICAPQVEFCYITDNTYFHDEVLQMESHVLQHLHFELSSPTIKSFLRRFIRAAQVCHQVQYLQLEFLANYLAELTLPEYSFIGYLPSLVAASAVFLAKFTLDPTKRPWTPTLKHYTRYQPSELQICVKELHDLQCNRQGCGLPAIREKYGQHKFKCVSTMVPPATIPLEFFSDF